MEERMKGREQREGQNGGREGEEGRESEKGETMEGEDLIENWFSIKKMKSQRQNQQAQCGSKAES